VSKTAFLRAALLTAVWAFQVPSAAAQSAADRETARQLMDRGDERVETGHLDEALGLYRGAHAIMNVPTTGIAVAETLARLGNLVEARDMALQVLRLPASREPPEPEPFQRARALAETLARELGQQIPTLAIQIVPRAARAAASLRIDGSSVPAAAIELPHALDPGSHRLDLRAPGFRARELHVHLLRADRKSLRVELEREVPPALTHGATLSTVRAPSASVTDGSDGSAPSAGTSAGKPSIPWPVWVGAGVGGAGILVGAIAGVVSLQHASAAKEFCDGNTCTSEARSDRDKAIRAANVSNAGWVAAGLGAAVSLTSLWLSAPERHEATSARALELRVVPSGAELHWQGTLW
jgi:hypothetical protein